jgi:hypothetical protein
MQQYTPVETEIIERLLSYERVPKESGDVPGRLRRRMEDPTALEPRWMCNQPVPGQLEPIIEALMDGDQHRVNVIDAEAGDETERIALWLESWARPIWDWRDGQWVAGQRERTCAAWAFVCAFAIRHGVRIEDLNCNGNWHDVRMRMPLSQAD